MLTGKQGMYLVLLFFFSFFSHPVYYLRPSILSLLVLVVTQIGVTSQALLPPLPTMLCALHFYRDKISALSSLVDSRRIVLIGTYIY